MIPVIMTVSDATIAVAPAVPAAANAVKPTAIVDRPAPAANNPPPIPRTATPSNAIAALSPKIAGTRGVRTAPAIPITVKAPARATSPFAIASQLIAPRILRTGASTAKAEAATIIAAEPDNVPVIAFNPIAIMAMEPPSVVNPFATPSHSILPILPRALAMIRRAVETAIRPVPMPTMFLGISLTAIVTAVKAPAIPVSPIASSFHCIVEKSFTAKANIFIAAPIATSATPVEITFFAFPVRFVKTVISANKIAIELSPFPISPHFI